MKKRYTKYRILKGFDSKQKAEKFLASLFDAQGADMPYFLKERRWFERDKKRYYVRELVRKGTKK